MTTLRGGGAEVGQWLTAIGSLVARTLRTWIHRGLDRRRPTLDRRSNPLVGSIITPLTIIVM
jgi:hypothetical protein